MHISQTLKAVAERPGNLLIYTSGFDNANCSLGKTFRGPGMEDGLRILEKMRVKTGLPILTDVHDASHFAAVAKVADVL